MKKYQKNATSAMAPVLPDAVSVAITCSPVPTASATLTVSGIACRSSALVIVLLVWYFLAEARHLRGRSSTR